MSGYIYKVENSVNHLVYIGQTRFTPEYRFRQHASCAYYNIDENLTKFHRAIREYGEQVFKVDALEECELYEMNEAERYYIRKFNSIVSGYNTAEGGGFRHEELDWDVIFFLWNDGLTVSEIASEVGYSHTHIHAVLKEYGINSVEQKRSHIDTCKEVVQINSLTKRIVYTFGSVTDASETLSGISGGANIIRVCLGTQDRAYSYFWRYKEDVRPEDLATGFYTGLIPKQRGKYNYNDIHSLWRDGRKVGEIASLVGADRTYIGRILAEFGVSVFERNSRSNHRKKAVLQVNLVTNTVVNYYESASDAARKCGFKADPSHIAKACRLGWQAYGFGWEYYDD